MYANITHNHIIKYEQQQAYYNAKKSGHKLTCHIILFHEQYQEQQISNVYNYLMLLKWDFS